MVGAGVLGRVGDDSAVALAVATPGPSARSDPGPVLAPALVPLTSSRLEMTVPRMRNFTVRSRAVDVAGTVVDADHVVVTLESRRSHLLESRTVAVLGGRFHTSFDLPNPRPGGRMFVSVVLVAANGLPIESIRRPIVSGDLVRMPVGEDGLMGGLVFPGT